MTDKPRVFISYRRSDGEAFATQLRKRLEREEPEITLWQDRARMEGGVGWRKQITDAIDAVQFMVLVMTPEAMESEVVRKEWRYARQQGVCIYPIKAAPNLDFDRLPRWMRDAHFYDLDREWETFIRHLKSPCQATRVPFMAPDLPAGFVQRPTEFQQLVAYLLDEERQNPVATTTALHGAGGFGKTTLAAALCHDDDVITAFDDGILWVTLGQKTPNILAALTTLYAALTDERPGFATEQDAATALTERLSDKDCLIVIDDVWNAAHLRPFLRGGERCARLITTRQFDIAADARRVDVDEMATDEAVQLLTARLEAPPDDLEPFRALARRLGEWPLMLELAGAALRQRLARGDTLEGALAYLNKALDKRGVVAFDQRNAEERNQAIAKSIAVSMDLLTEDERERYLQLAIFPEDTDVPLSAVGALWRLDDFDTEEQAQRLDDLSLLKFNLQAGTIRLHDVMRAYLAHQLAEPAEMHAALLEAWGDPHHLPNDYAWRWLAYHLKEAGQVEELRILLFDFDWLQAKLEATDVNALMVDYDFAPHDADLRLVQGAIRLAAHILAQDSTQLAGQLLGRLLGHEALDIQTMLEQAKKWRAAPWLRPLTSSLMPPGGPLIRTLRGHTSKVLAVAVTGDGRRAVSGSEDTTLRVWDLESGEELATLQGHADYVCAVAVTGDGRRAVSGGSWYNTLKVWDISTGLNAGLESGEELATLRGHANWVSAVAVTGDGRRAVSGSWDNTLKVWDLESGEELATLQGHTGAVEAVAVTGDERRAVSGSRDNTLKVWDISTGLNAGLESGEELATLRGHTDWVGVVVVTGDERRAVSGSRDNTLKVWDLESGEELTTLRGHTSWVSAVAVTGDGRRAVSGSYDKTLKVWDLESGEELATLQGHTDDVCAVAVMGDERRAVSGSWDQTLKVWDISTGLNVGLKSGEELATLRGHTSVVSAVAVTGNGRRAVSGSYDETLKVWDLESGEELATLRGHTSMVFAVAVTGDGQRAVSGSRDNTLKVWDISTGLNAGLESGEELATLRGHTAWVSAVALTEDGRRAVSGSYDETLKVWDLESGEELTTLRGHTSWVRAVAVTGDGRRAISGSDDETLKVWDLESGEELATLRGHTSVVSAVAVTGDGRRAVSGSWDHMLKVWDLESGEELATLRGHTDSVWAVTVTGDGRRAVSGSGDHTLKVWDLESGKVVATFIGDGPLYACAVALDGETLVAAGVLGRVHILRLEGAG